MSFSPGSLDYTDLSANAGILGTQIADGTIQTRNFAPNAIYNTFIVDNTITEQQIETDSITAASIASLNFTGKNAIFDTGTIGGWTLSASEIYASGNVDIRAGQTAYNTGTGFWLGNDAGTPKFSIGDGSTNFLTWNGTSLAIGGSLTATSGTIGGFTIGASKLYGGTIQTAATVDGTHTGVVMDTAGLRGYDSVLGETFNLPTDGSAPTFSSGVINSTTFNIDTSSVLKTSTNALSGVGGDAGVLIDNSGFYAGSAGQSTSDANVQLKADGTFKLYSDSADALIVDHGGNILMKEGGYIDFTPVDDPTTGPTAALVATGTGNVDAGQHVYAANFVTSSAKHTLTFGSSSVTTDGSHKQVSLSGIPVSSSAAVIRRDIYRSKAGTTTPLYYLASINDNTTTTYTDNIADSSLGPIAPTTNTTTGSIYITDSLEGTNQVLRFVPAVDNTAVLTVQNGFRRVQLNGNIDFTNGDQTDVDVNMRINTIPIVTTSDTQTLTNKTISGSSNTISNIGNAALTNSAITIAGTSTSLGGSISQDTITGLSTTGVVERTGANTLTTVTAPSGTIVGTSDTQTLTNKTLTDSTNTVSSKVLTVPYNFSYYRNSAATTGNLAFSKITFDTQIYDTGSNVSSGVFTAPVAGYYHFDARASVQSGTRFIVSLFKNNAEYHRGHDTNSSISGGNVSATIKLAANDTVDVRVLGSSAISLEVGNTYSTYFNGYLISTT